MQAIRRILRRPGFGIVIVLVVTLSLGLAVTAASLAYEVFLRPLPFRDGDRLAIYCCPFPRQGEGWRDAPGSPAAMRDYQTAARLADQVAIFYDQHSLSLTGDAENSQAERLPVTFVTGNYFPVLGVSPALGRYFGQAECQEGTAHQLVVVSHIFWRNYLNARPDAVGATIRLNGLPYTVIGVMPEKFRDLSNEAGPPQLWLPMPMAAPYLGPNFLSNYSLSTFHAAVRLKPNVSFETAQREADVIARSIELTQPNTHHGRTIRLMPAREFFFLKTRKPVLVLFGGAFLVLLLAAINLANLFTVDALSRKHEFSLRAALGADSGQLARTALLEAVIPLLIGAIPAISLSIGLIAVFNRMGTLALPDFAHVEFSASVLLAAMGLLGIVMSIAATAPVLRARRVDLQSALRSGSKGAEMAAGGRTRNLLIALEVALASALLVATGLTARSLMRMVNLDSGYNPHRLLSFQIQLDRQRLPAREQRINFARQLNDTLQGGPGIEAALLWGPSMLSQAGWSFEVTPAGLDLNDPASALNVQHLHTIPGGLSRLGIPLVRGRDFSPGAVPEYPIEVIIDQEAARRLWPGQDPLGKTMYLFHDRSRPMTVIGLVPHVYNRGRAFDDAKYLTGDAYASFYQMAQDRITVLLRYRTGQEGLVLTWARGQLAKLDSNLAPFDVATIEERMVREVQGPRFTATIFTIYASVSLVLAVVGIYGVLAFAIAQRTREFGVRFAVGASRLQVVGLVLRQGMVWIGAGLGVGFLLALYGVQLLDGLLIGGSQNDGIVFGLTATIILLSGLLAMLLPAIRAARVDPLAALRSE